MRGWPGIAGVFSPGHVSKGISREPTGQGQIISPLLDATQDQTDVDAFAVLEPVADGFRNYFKGPAGVPVEHLLLDKAQQLTLTAGVAGISSPGHASKGTFREPRRAPCLCRLLGSGLQAQPKLDQVPGDEGSPPREANKPSTCRNLLPRETGGSSYGQASSLTSP